MTTLPDDTREKTAMLVKVAGWKMDRFFLDFRFRIPGEQDLITTGDLYHEMNMSLAIRTFRHFGSLGFDDYLSMWLYDDAIIWEDDFQTRILDEVLTLAIEAGLVEVDE